MHAFPDLAISLVSTTLIALGVFEYSACNMQILHLEIEVPKL